MRHQETEKYPSAKHKNKLICTAGHRHKPRDEKHDAACFIAHSAAQHENDARSSSVNVAPKSPHQARVLKLVVSTSSRALLHMTVFRFAYHHQPSCQLNNRIREWTRCSLQCCARWREAWSFGVRASPGLIRGCRCAADELQ